MTETAISIDRSQPELFDSKSVPRSDPPPLALTMADGAVRCHPLNGGSMPVGMFGESEFSVHSYPVTAGTRILVYSDGVLGDPPAMDDLRTLCAELAGDPEWLDVLVERRFGRHHGDDDCSLVELAFPDPAPVVGDAAGAASAARQLTF